MPRVFVSSPDHNGWGNAIHLSSKLSDDGRRWSIYGWKQNTPEPGDIVLVIQADRSAAHSVQSIRRPGNPPDMFFGEIMYVKGLADEITDRWSRNGRAHAEWMPRDFDLDISDAAISKEINSWPAVPEQTEAKENE